MIAVAAVALTMAVALWGRRENELRALARQRKFFDIVARAHTHYMVDGAFLSAIPEIRAQPGAPLPNDFGPWFPLPPDPPEPK